MSFRLFIYYCALAGGWAAFLAWAVVQVTGMSGRDVQPYLKAGVIGGVLGAFVAAAIGLVEAILNDKGAQRLVRMLACGILGVFAGAIGGLFGTWLYREFGLPLFLGWMLAGLLIGASVGAFDLTVSGAGALRKILNGVIGGVAGGLVGGLPFGFLASVDALPRGGLAMGLVLLGIGIGLAVGLAQVLLKEAWLRVEEGFRAGRELMLSKEETTIGRGEACDLGLFGDNTIERTHARIVLKNNRYMLAHAADAGETYLNGTRVAGRPVPLSAGDQIQIGKSVLRFGERQKRD